MELQATPWSRDFNPGLKNDVRKSSKRCSAIYESVEFSLLAAVESEGILGKNLRVTKGLSGPPASALHINLTVQKRGEGQSGRGKTAAAGHVVGLSTQGCGALLNSKT